MIRALTHSGYAPTRRTCAPTDRLLSVVVNTLGKAQAHHGYLFANARASRIKLLVHDGCMVCHTAAARGAVCRVKRDGALAPALQLSRQRSFDALVLGLPWQRLEELSVIGRT